MSLFLYFSCTQMSGMGGTKYSANEVQQRIDIFPPEVRVLLQKKSESYALW